MGSPVRRFILQLMAALALVLGLSQPLAHAEQSGAARPVPVLEIDGAIGPATADYVAKGIEVAGEEGAPFLLIEMNTPGGLDTSMRQIILAVVNAPMPVVTYVAPRGARAASAGAFILMASHVAAMAPGTNVGAASPVQLGAPGPGSGAEPKPGDAAAEKDGTKDAAPARSTSEAKAMNDAIAYIRSLAEMRGRNAEWAEAAVRDAASLSASAALKDNVIEIVARDRADLLDQLHERSVMVNGLERQIMTDNVSLADVAPDWRTQLLAAVTDPNIALILMMIGAYGLLFEFMNPGALYPGTIGAICLLVGLYALSALPVNYAGIALILLGMALMAAEAFSPSFGILGIGGIAAFLFGALIMFDTDIPQFRVALPILGAVAVASLGLTFVIVRLALKSRRSEVATGREEMIGLTAKVLDWDEDSGHVHVHGERWSARGGSELRHGDNVRVTGIDGLVLGVERTDQ